MPTRIVIIGGSFGGVNSAYALGRALGKTAEITVIAKDAEFTFIPSLPWVIMRWRQPDRIQIGLAKSIERRGIRFVHGTVQALYPIRGEMFTAHDRFPYDFQVTASGAELDYAAVPGLGPQGGCTHSTVTTQEAVAARDALARTLSAKRGRIVIGAAAGASRVGPAYEVVLMIDTALRRARRRHRFRVGFVTPEPVAGHFGLGAIGNFPRFIEDEFAERDIEATVSAKVLKVRIDRLVLPDGSEKPFDLSPVVPAFLGALFVCTVKGLANPKGFINITSQLSRPKLPNVYAVGVAVAIAPVGPTPVSVAVPKTGHLTKLMAQAAARNIVNESHGGTKVDGLNMPVRCIADAGNPGCYFSADPFLPPRNKVVHRRGAWACFLKLAFEKYYLAPVRRDLPSAHFGWQPFTHNMGGVLQTIRKRKV